MTVFSSSRAAFLRAGLILGLITTGCVADARAEVSYEPMDGWMKGWVRVQRNDQPKEQASQRYINPVEAQTCEHMLTEEDVEALSSQRGEPNVAHYTPNPHPATFKNEILQETVVLRGPIHLPPQKQAEIMVAQIAAAANMQQIPRIQLVSAPEFNAYTDGYSIGFTTALWKACTTDDQRAFVIAHEVSHILLNHVQQKPARRNTMRTVRNVGLQVAGRFIPYRVGQYTNRPMWQASDVGIKLADLKFNRVQEYNADDLGIKLMAKAGYNPEGAPQAMEVLQAGAGDSRTAEFLRTHPITENRIQKLVTKSKDLNSI